MACFNTLPTELLQKIIENIPGRPFKTELLLLSKALCTLLMIEQVRNLELYSLQIDSWITIIKKKKGLPALKYRNLLDKIYGLTVHVDGTTDSKKIVGFTNRCRNIRYLTLKSSIVYSLRPDFGPIFTNLSSNLIEINFIRVKVGNEETIIQSLANYVRRSKKLVKLEFFEAAIGKEEAQVIVESFTNSSIKQLSLSHNEIGTEGAYALAKCLKQNKTITDLNLEYNGLCVGGVLILIEGVKQNTTLKTLNLEENNIGDQGVLALTEYPKQNMITNLSLGWNGINAMGACGLADYLEENTVLVDLNLMGNSIGTEGACFLAKGLQQNTTLIYLNLYRNDIGDEGACALADCLEKNATLTNLDLGYNGIGTEGACALAECLKKNTTLTDLNLSWNSVGIEGASALTKALQQNTTLTYLDLKDNSMGFADTISLSEGLKRDINLILSENDMDDEDMYDDPFLYTI